MKPNKLIGLVAVGLILPSTAVVFGNPVLAEVRVKTANVEAVTRNDGNIYVNTGGTTINVSRHHPRGSWNPLRYWQLPWQSYNKDRHCRQTIYQSTRQTTHSGNHTVQHSSYSDCK